MKKIMEEYPFLKDSDTFLLFCKCFIRAMQRLDGRAYCDMRPDDLLYDADSDEFFSVGADARCAASVKLASQLMARPEIQQFLMGGTDFFNYSIENQFCGSRYLPKNVVSVMTDKQLQIYALFDGFLVEHRTLKQQMMRVVIHFLNNNAVKNGWSPVQVYLPCI